jgi:hypothetical protein
LPLLFAFFSSTAHAKLSPFLSSELNQFCDINAEFFERGEAVVDVG